MKALRNSSRAETRRLGPRLVRAAAVASATGALLSLLAGCGTTPASSGGSTATSTTDVADPAAKAHDIEQDLKAAARAGGLSLLDEPTRDEQGCVVGYLLQPLSQNGPDPVDATVTSLHDNGWGGERRSQAKGMRRVTLTKEDWTLRVRDYSAQRAKRGFVALLATKASCGPS
ncbi:hypothetical protein ACFRIB_06090 [Streptomyces mirabilis]|uniref:hypothetical protein n=1 Tax=Streptomyces mirabilis TaxID=68239 RepID=UPI0036ADB30D